MPPISYEAISAKASEHGVSPDVLYGLMLAESSGDPNAVNPNPDSTAKGAFQQTKAFREDYGVSDPFDPMQEADAAARAISHFTGIYGDERLAVLAYNQGPGTVNRLMRDTGAKDWESLGSSVPSSTKSYVEKVFKEVNPFSVPEAQAEDLPGEGSLLGYLDPSDQVAPSGVQPTANPHASVFGYLSPDEIASAAPAPERSVFGYLSPAQVRSTHPGTLDDFRQDVNQVVSSPDFFDKPYEEKVTELRSTFFGDKENGQRTWNPKQAPEITDAYKEAVQGLRDYDNIHVAFTDDAVNEAAAQKKNVEDYRSLIPPAPDVSKIENVDEARAVLDQWEGQTLTKLKTDHPQQWLENGEVAKEQIGRAVDQAKNILQSNAGARGVAADTDLTGKFNTPLSDNEQQQFQDWVQKQSQLTGRDRASDLYNYDLQGFFKDNGPVDLTPEQHLPDTYKKPNHPTFSVESKYSTADDPGGHWEGDKFVAPETSTDTLLGRAALVASATKPFIKSAITPLVDATAFLAKSVGAVSEDTADKMVRAVRTSKLLTERPEVLEGKVGYNIFGKFIPLENVASGLGTIAGVAGVGVATGGLGEAAGLAEGVAQAAGFASTLGVGARAGYRSGYEEVLNKTQNEGEAIQAGWLNAGVQSVAGAFDFAVTRGLVPFLGKAVPEAVKLRVVSKLTEMGQFGDVIKSGFRIGDAAVKTGAAGVAQEAATDFGTAAITGDPSFRPDAQRLITAGLTGALGGIGFGGLAELQGVHTESERVIGDAVQEAKEITQAAEKPAHDIVREARSAGEEPPPPPAAPPAEAATPPARTEVPVSETEAPSAETKPAATEMPVPNPETTSDVQQAVQYLTDAIHNHESGAIARQGGGSIPLQSKESRAAILDLRKKQLAYLQEHPTATAEELAQAVGSISPLAVLPPGMKVGQASIPETKPAASKTPTSAISSLEPESVPLKNLEFNPPDLPQFKSEGDERGIVQPLSGKFEKLGTAPIVVFETNDGRQIIASGRHRADLAIRSGEENISAQVLRESDGYTFQDAQIVDAELNIRDEQGSVRDYVDFFRARRYSREEAEARGLLSRAKGQQGFAIAANAEGELAALYNDGKISSETAARIANAAPGDANLQRVGSAAILKGQHPDTAVSLIQIAKRAKPEEGAQLDMFGAQTFKQAEQYAETATSLRREAENALSTITSAQKLGKKGKAALEAIPGLSASVDIKDPAATKRAVTELKERVRNLSPEHWPTSPEMVREIEQRLNEKLKESGDQLSFSLEKSTSEPAAPPVERTAEAQKKIDESAVASDQQLKLGISPVREEQFGTSEVMQKLEAAHQAAVDAGTPELSPVSQDVMQEFQGQEAGQYLRTSHDEQNFFADRWLEDKDHETLARDLINPETPDALAHMPDTTASVVRAKILKSLWDQEKEAQKAGDHLKASELKMLSTDFMIYQYRGQRTGLGQALEIGRLNNELLGITPVDKVMSLVEDIVNTGKRLDPEMQKEMITLSAESDSIARDEGAIKDMASQIGLGADHVTNLQAELKTRQQEIETRRTELVAKQQELQQQQRELEQAGKQLTTKGKRQETTQTKKITKLESQVRDLTSKVEEAQKAFDARKAELDAERKALQKEKASLAGKLKRYPERAERLESEHPEKVAALEKRIAELEPQVKAAEDAFNARAKELREQTSELQKQKTSLEGRAERYPERQAKLEEKARTKIAELQKQIPELQARVDEAQRALERTQARFKEQSAKIKADIADYRRLEKTLTTRKQNVTKRELKLRQKRAAKREGFLLKTLPESVQGEIKKLAEKFEATDPDSYLRQELAGKMINVAIKASGGVSPLELANIIWYTNAVAGLSTQGINAFGSGLHLLLKSSEFALRNPRTFPDYLRSLIYSGIPKGIAEASTMLREGRVGTTGGGGGKFGISAAQIEHATPKSTLEGLFQGGLGGGFKAFAESPHKVVEGLTGLGIGKFANRGLKAVDAFWYRTSFEAMAGAQLAMKAREFGGLSNHEIATKISDSLFLSSDRAKLALAQAEGEVKAALGAEGTKRDVVRRAIEIMDRQLPPDVWQEGNRWGLETTFNEVPHGVFGAVANGINTFVAKSEITTPFGSFRAAQPFFPFVNIVANVAEAGLEFSPLGLIKEVSLRGREIPRNKRIEIATRALIGSAIGTGLLSAAWHFIDDDDPWFTIYGSGDPLPKARKDQMREAGWRPNTFKIGSLYLPYHETPLYWMAAFGAYFDNKRWNSKFDEKTSEGILKIAMAGVGSAFLDEGALKGISDVFALAKGERNVLDLPATYLSVYLPGGGFAKDLDRIFNAQFQETVPVAGHEMVTRFVGSFFKNYPVVGAYVNKPLLNGFGEVVSPTIEERFGLIRRTLGTMRRDDLDPEWKFLGEHGLNFNGFQNIIPIGKGSDKQKRHVMDVETERAETLGRAYQDIMTPEERYNFILQTGPRIKDAIHDVMLSSEGKTREQLQGEIDDAVSAIKKNGKAEMVLGVPSRPVIVGRKKGHHASATFDLAGAP